MSSRAPTSPGARSARRLVRSPSAWAGAVLVVAFAGGGLFASALAPYGPYDISAEGQERPSRVHLLGTDNLGRDLLSRVLYGARISFGVGLVSIGLAMLVGVPAGSLAGYFGGWVDTLVMRGVDVLMALPGILLAIIVWAVLGPGLVSIVLAVGVVNVPIFARQMRASVLTVRQHDYVVAARAAGASTLHILVWVVLPNVLSPIIVLSTLGLGTAILEAAGLSFLGLGGEPNLPEWGNMLASTRDYFLSGPWMVLAPGAAISLTILGFNLLGDALRDALDPHLK
jgi:peptide/nickel transport system permease protein